MYRKCAAEFVSELKRLMLLQKYLNIYEYFMNYRFTKCVILIKGVIMNTENFITLREYNDHIIGELMMVALREAGIQAFKIDEMNTTLPIENEFIIKVHESDFEAALKVVEGQESKD